MEETTELAESVPAALPALPVATVATVNCPFCDELVSVNAKKCKHCGETIDVSMRKAEEALRAANTQAPVYMNAGGGGGAAAVSAGVGAIQLRPWGHGWHILLSVVTIGWWIPVWILLYVFRNKSVYF